MSKNGTWKQGSREFADTGSTDLPSGGMMLPTSYLNALTYLARNMDACSASCGVTFRALTELASFPMGVRRTGLWVYDREQCLLRCEDLYDAATDKHAKGTELSMRAFPAFRKALCRDAVIMTDDVAADDRTAQFVALYFRPRGIMSVLNVPLKHDGDLIGLLCHEHVGSFRQWTADEAAVADAIGKFAAMVLETHRRKTTGERLQRSVQGYRASFQRALSWV